MKIKDVNLFRDWYKNEYKLRKNDQAINPDFIGYRHDNTLGFIDLVHGAVPDIANFLSTPLKIAQDDQAIYEFIQNAADAQSSLFNIFYDESYFVAINNGKPFSRDDLTSLLNIAASTKKSCEKIGRFGIGFKLAYRLLGKTTGAEEMMRDNKGPVVFSWSKTEHIESLLKLDADQLKQGFDKGDWNAEDAPWLFKILLTCFPVHPEDAGTVDLQNKQQVLFPKEELLEYVTFLKKYEHKLNLKELGQGSLFFIKLGNGKYDKLLQNEAGFKKGVEISLNFLKKLREVKIGDHIEITQPVDLSTSNVEITIPKTDKAYHKIFDLDKQKLAEADEYDWCDLKVFFGYLPYRQSEDILKKAPSFYKYFPMKTEVNNFNFILHSNYFDTATDRQRMENYNDANIRLFETFSERLTQHFDTLIPTDFATYKDIFPNILLSDEPTTERTAWLNAILYQPLFQYIKEHIPTKEQHAVNRHKVLLKNTELPFHPRQFGVDKEWFFWDEVEDPQVVEVAIEKLGLTAWNFVDLFQQGSLPALNQLIGNTQLEEYALIHDEIKAIDEDTWTANGEFLLNKFLNIQYYKFSNDRYYSINAVANSGNFILLPQLLEPIRGILIKLGFMVSEHTFAPESSVVEDTIQERISYLADPTLFFDMVNAKTQNNQLAPKEKQRLFATLLNIEGIEVDQWKQFQLFCNTEGRIVPLGELLSASKEIKEEWLVTHKINGEEYTPDLEEFLTSVSEVYATRIYPDWEDIVQHPEVIQDGAGFYASVQRYYEADSTEADTLAAKKCLYTMQGFQSADYVFFNTALREIGEMEYSSLQMAVSKLTNLLMPDYQVLPYLGNAPFDVPNQALPGQIQTTYLERDEAQNLLKYLNESQEDFSKFVEQKLFVFSNDEMYSLDEVIETENALFVFDKLQKHRQALRDFDFILSEINLSEYAHLQESLQSYLPYLENEQMLFDRFIQAKLETDDLKASQKHKLFDLVKSLETIALDHLELFSNQHGHIQPLSSLLAPSIEVATWLQPFKIQREDYDEVLDEYLLQDTSEIYQSLIVPHWDSITAHVLSDEFPVQRFCEQLQGYFAAAKEKLGNAIATLEAQQLPYIYTADGFKTRDEVFFHPTLGKVQDFENLRVLLGKMTGLHVPEAEVMEALQPVSAFEVAEANDFAEYLVESNDTYTEEELKSWLELMVLAGYPFFEQAYLEPRFDSFTITPHDNALYQFYTEDEVIDDLIAFKASFKKLPAPFYRPELADCGLMQDGLQMYKEILRLSGFDVALMPYVFEGDLEIKTVFLEQMETLELAQQPGEQYSEDSLEFRCLLMAHELYNAEFDIEAFRDKVRIDGQYRLQEVAVHEEVYEGLPLAAILPERAKMQEIAAQLTTQLMEFPAIDFINEVIFRPEAANKVEVFEAIKAQEDARIKSGAQLAFLILYKQEGGDFVFHDFTIVAMDEQVYAAEYFYYTHPLSFVRADATLKAHYQPVTQYLAIDAARPAYRVNPTFVIGCSPYFEDGELVCPSLKEELGQDERRDFVAFLFDQWHKNEEARTAIAETEWTTINDLPVAQVLGFVPAQLVLQEGVVSGTEDIPAYLQQWLEAEEDIRENKELFLKDLGVNTGDSIAVQLRNFLTQGGAWDLEEKPVNDLNETLLAGALDFMQKQATVFADEARLQVLHDIYHQLDYDTYLGKVPMVYVYNFKNEYTEYILQPKAENDFYFNENTLNHLEGQDITLQQVFKVLKAQGKPLMPMEVYPKKWGKKSAERIHLSSPKLDVDQLMQRANEWEADYYKKWRETTEVDHRVFFYANTLPYSLFFQDEALYTEEREEGSVIDDQHRLFISKKGAQSVDELVKEFLPSGEYVSFLEAKAQSGSVVSVSAGNGAQAAAKDEDAAAKKAISDKLAQFIIEKGLTDDDISDLEAFLASRKK
ncbi:sacsin N-terminal ATP-binding-like domain-containing protein [Microscilla marina]|uniref:Uncharacterized protein n=1 Tax=Microscilla marina ATCC 23134 TaxID=313606 RepID=A1ZBZ3_MICM2|nr:ATP-binding protein [Microscilla marina]EAY31795.1 hypothetical protein M23134_01824 [Microscilla marina ATCC 23134]